jgi:hypothetical protein
VAINSAGYRASTCAYGNPQSTTAITSETATLSSSSTKTTSSKAHLTGNSSFFALNNGSLSRSDKIALRLWNGCQTSCNTRGSFYVR